VDVSAPGSVIRNQSSLWRASGQEGDIFIVISTDSNETEQGGLCVPSEASCPYCLELLLSHKQDHSSAQDFLLHTCRPNLPITAPPISTQLHHAILCVCQLLPMVESGLGELL
jgi:hypothetical protein